MYARRTLASSRCVVIDLERTLVFSCLFTLGVTKLPNYDPPALPGSVVEQERGSAFAVFGHV
jgi:hypothetical protein